MERIFARGESSSQLGRQKEVKCSQDTFQRNESDKQHTEWKRDNTLKAFQDTFETVIQPEKDGWFQVRSHDSTGGGNYNNYINIAKGEIALMINFKKNTKNLFLSDVMYNQLLLVLSKAEKDIADFDLKKCTASIPLDPEAKAIKKAITYFLEQHQEAFPNKKLKKITKNPHRLEFEIG